MAVVAERNVIIHREAVKDWLRRPEPPLPKEDIVRALRRMEEVTKSNPDDVIEVEGSPNDGFPFLPSLVGAGNSARLFGARAGVCLAIARETLVEAGIETVLDEEGALP